MQDIKAIAHEIVAREGGYVDDPDDPGGATNHGVTLGTLQRFDMDLTGDGRIDRADVAAVSVEHAAELYIRHYFNTPRIAALPQQIRGFETVKIDAAVKVRDQVEAQMAALLRDRQTG